ncbi:SDR family NAD(P)-dependent oxidoreductase [Mycobacterium sp. AZCC_0083]|uniref:SDR family NAD(P)-dependent oxidoreductase n=1 Tax=Mycobacterium sp. AZCC_0083 TaxID=2735882 RepID=UPI00161DE22F|nr:SDR family NAD(P)-dependent oxidoreductase [Mycobacterium sp. AZCC_0083]
MCEHVHPRFVAHPIAADFDTGRTRPWDCAHVAAGKSALVTGGRGLGVAIAVELSRAGANLALVGRTDETLRAAASSLTGEASAGPRAVSGIMVGRWLNRSYPSTKAFMRSHLGAGFDPNLCPVSGRACAGPE